MLDADLPKVNLPAYVQDLRDAAASGDGKLYQSAVRTWSSKIEALGEGAAGEAGAFTLRSASKQLVRDLARAKVENVDKIVDRWILEKARYQARLVARNEAVEAFRDATIQQAREQPWVAGIRWVLSPEHPRPDVCDMHAMSDQYGLGPGGYPPDKVPARHPSCLCSLVSISDADYLKREVAKSKGEPEPEKPWLTGVKESPEDWLRKQSAEVLHEIVGPTRAKLVKQGRRVIDPGAANFRPVYELQRQPKPSRDLGPRVDASEIVRRDRENQVTPFPRLNRQ